MKKLVLTFILLSAVSISEAASVLWLDIRGDLSNVSGTPFGTWFENNTIPEKATSEDGIDVIAVDGNGTPLYWWFHGEDPVNDIYHWQYGVYLLSDGVGFDYAYSSMANQLDISELEDNDVVRLMAGYLDWDNVDLDSDEIDLGLFTPFAYTEAKMSDLDNYIFQGFLKPYNFIWF